MISLAARRWLLRKQLSGETPGDGIAGRRRSAVTLRVFQIWGNTAIVDSAPFRSRGDGSPSISFEKQCAVHNQDAADEHAFGESGNDRGANALRDLD